MGTEGPGREQVAVGQSSPALLWGGKGGEGTAPALPSAVTPLLFPLRERRKAPKGSETSRGGEQRRDGRGHGRGPGPGPSGRSLR